MVHYLLIVAVEANNNKQAKLRVEDALIDFQDDAYDYYSTDKDSCFTTYFSDIVKDKNVPTDVINGKDHLELCKKVLADREHADIDTAKRYADELKKSNICSTLTDATAVSKLMSSDNDTSLFAMTQLCDMLKREKFDSHGCTFFDAVERTTSVKDALKRLKTKPNKQYLYALDMHV